jgi:hypothetical protein
MFAVVDTGARASQYEGLLAESIWKLQRVPANVLGMLT